MILLPVVQSPPFSPWHCLLILKVVKTIRSLAGGNEKKMHISNAIVGLLVYLYRRSFSPIVPILFMCCTCYYYLDGCCTNFSSMVDKRLFADSQKTQIVSGYISIVRICLLYIDIKIILTLLTF